MEKSIFSKLPDEIIKYILLFDKHFIYRDKKIISIDSISKLDNRYILLQDIPKKYKMGEHWSVILNDKKSKKRFVLGYRIIINKWEYFFYTFKYDFILNQMKDKPDSFIYSYI